MIYLDDLNSIIESVYLNEGLSNKSGNCNIFVNPENIKYLFGKVVIINKLDYPEENILKLLDNKCNIISRVNIFNKIDGIKTIPYILRINTDIMWNGKTIKNFDNINDLINNNHCDYDLDTSMLFFPKIILYPTVQDSDNNLTALGWALQQVGVNIIKDTVFKDLDILKTGKLNL